MGTKLIKSISEIAEMAGVSKSTVSRALNNSPLIGTETRERIQAIASEHNFCISAPARQLSSKQSNTIGFAMEAYHKDFSVADLFTLEIIGGISKSLHASGYDMLVLYMDADDARWAQKYLDSNRVDGFILMPCTRKLHHIHELANLGAPFIVWGVPQPNFCYCTVTGDNLTGGKLATQYLIQQGRRQIGFLGGPADEMEVKLRYEGYQTALQSAGRQVDSARVVHGNYTASSGMLAIERLLEQTPDLDAVFVNSDLMAIAAIKTLHRKGMRVPDDIAVVGYDDLTISETNDPSLTTVRQHIPRAAALLAQNLIQYLQTGLITNATIPVELVIRESA
jgi:DNA-binding LacI/PurR family transcriptional regulator